MEQNLKNIGNRPNRLFSRLAAEKRKTVMALCLVAVMVFMWVRVLGRKTPQSAEAALTAQETIEDESNSELKISFIELPNVEGRDVLAGDFFAVDDWQEFVSGREGGRFGGIEEVNVVSKDGRKEVAGRVAEKLKLKAIELGKKPQAFINDKLLAVGDKLLVKDRVDTYECEIVGIEQNAVFIKCGEAEITLRLTQASVTN